MRCLSFAMHAPSAVAEQMPHAGTLAICMTQPQSRNLKTPLSCGNRAQSGCSTSRFPPRLRELALGDTTGGREQRGSSSRMGVPDRDGNPAQARARAGLLAGLTTGQQQLHWAHGWSALRLPCSTLCPR